MNDIHPMALFRYSVLGTLVSRAELQRGELKSTLQELAARHYDIPGSRNSLLSEKTIEAWYYAWRRGGIEALTPKARSDRGQSKIAPEVQEVLSLTLFHPVNLIRIHPEVGRGLLDSTTSELVRCWE